MNRYRTEHELLQCFSKPVTEQTELSEQKTVCFHTTLQPLEVHITWCICVTHKLHSNEDNECQEDEQDGTIYSHAVVQSIAIIWIITEKYQLRCKVLLQGDRRRGSGGGEEEGKGWGERWGERWWGRGGRRGGGERVGGEVVGKRWGERWWRRGGGNRRHTPSKEQV